MPKQVVLVGHPVSHSLSGELQQAAFDDAGVDARYEPLDVPLMTLPETIDQLRGDEYLGANITVPYKERVAPMMDRLTEEAQATGAVDTITRESTRLVGHNTDVVGFRAALDALVGQAEDAQAGGDHRRRRRRARRGLRFHHQRLPARDHLQPPPASRGRAGSPLRAQRSHMELRAMPWHESVIEAELAKTKILVNASALSDAGNQSPIPGELLPPDLMVLDLMYQPGETKLMRDARHAGSAEVLNGDTMLLHQTAAAFNLWTGRDVSLDFLQHQLDSVREHPVSEVAAGATD